MKRKHVRMPDTYRYHHEDLYKKERVKINTKERFNFEEEFSGKTVAEAINILSNLNQQAIFVYDYDYDGGFERWELESYSEETDAQFELRLKWVEYQEEEKKIMKKQQNEQERKEYERLKKKFEKKRKV